ncbi:MAG: hypothetical protein GF381_03800 [Candidatus Pacebacteria bacterium]|nr:hypothetical protein [Candidatus Paceibacterota bacterium]
MKKLFFHPITALILTILTILFVFSLRSNQEKVRLSRENIKNLKKVVDQAQTEVEQKQAQLETAKQPLTKEKIIRNKLLLQRPGEHILQIQDFTIIEQREDKKTETNPWQEWKKILFE